MTKRVITSVFVFLVLGLSLLSVGPGEAKARLAPLADGPVSASAMLTAADFPMLSQPAAAAAPGDNHAAADAAALPSQEASCGQTVTADVVALDQPFYYNRMGAMNANGMIYALRNDIVEKTPGGGLVPGNVMLRPDKRARPLVLRVNVGDCLEIHFTNLLSVQPFIFNLPGEFPTGPIPGTGTGGSINPQVDDQPVTRAASIHIDGLFLKGSIGSDGSFVGQNDSSLVEPGDSATYTYYAAHENTYLMYSMGSTLGGEGNGGTRAYGLFGAVNVEPDDADWYRSQLTRLDMDMAASAWNTDGSPTAGNLPRWNPAAVNPATGQPSGYWAVRSTPAGQPILNYDAVYPAGTGLGKDGLPIVKMRSGNNLVHSDLNAVITGPGRGLFGGWYAANPAMPGRDRPFREFTVIFHDEIFAVQAFPSFYNDPVLEHTLHGVTDGFAINYGTGGIGSEIIANRLGVGPMWDCAECKYEEFFLTAWAVGDPAQVVDIPANADLNGDGLPDPGPKASKVLYPDDPSNVHHSYLNDRVIFRNLHAGPKEHHIFHLHAHQWLWSPNDPQSNYLDSQAVGPGTGYTYEIAYGGSGNRNKTPGDSIFHCHFYPHFAQGMWELWRTHDVFEPGTVLDQPVNGTPVAGARALADGEIIAGTPIPALVPLPGYAMAPMPDTKTRTVPYDLNSDGLMDSSQVDSNGDNIADIAQNWAVAPTANPGYPFYIPGLAGHRPPNPVLDLATEDTNRNGKLDAGEDLNKNGKIDVMDGGLPRHIVTSGPGKFTDAVEQVQTRLDFNKIVHKATAMQVPEDGTAIEKLAMSFHAQRWQSTFKTDGTATQFETNGLPAKPGAPYADPCRTDDGLPLAQTRHYRAAVIQTDVTINKVGWHFPQQRFEALWEDVKPLLLGKKAPEPLVIRLNTRDCVEFWHTNLVPSVYELDDYQVRTPTDIVGQHIHLVKFDVTSADGSANGWNYEDGTISPDETRERIDAFNLGGFKTTANKIVRNLQAKPHPFFGATGPNGQNWRGARTTIQRWYADPLLARSWDGGVGTVFTHDHYGPSTHQQVGLYATVLVEPEGSQWRDPETGVMMGTRLDGGPTSWRADILTPDTTSSHREFYLEFADFQHAYLAGGGNNGPDFANAINPSFRQAPPTGRESDLAWFPNACPGDVPRPCPEAISADDPGTYVVNYRNEPIGLRVYNNAGGQTTGDPGDLALAFESRTDRAIAALNTRQGQIPYPALTGDVNAGDPATPILRTYVGDKVRIRLQAGAHEEEHTFTLHGMKWKHEVNGGNSGWSNSQEAGISEYANFDVPVPADIASPGFPKHLDYLYTIGAQTEDLWNGVWGIFRTYGKVQTDLLPLPNNGVPKKTGKIATNEKNFDETCPIKEPVNPSPIKTFKVTAVRAVDVLGPDGLVYNTRAMSVLDPLGGVQGTGPLTDPSALLYVRTEDLLTDAAGNPIGLKPGTPIEPLVLRASAGDCLKVELTNALPADLRWTDANGNSRPDMPGFNELPPIVNKDTVNGGIVTFNSNDLTPSSMVGLHPQLVAYNVRTSDGLSVGKNKADGGLVAPGQTRTYTWYAGDITMRRNADGTITLVATPVEFGVVNLMPADRIKGSGKGLVGALVIEPKGATWREDPGSRTAATVTKANGSKFREFVTVIQDDLNLRYSGGCNGDFLQAMNCAVPAMVSEGPGVPEDPQDSGQKAINYGADPLWFRLGLAPNTPFEEISRNPDLKDPIRDIFSNGMSGGSDPQTPVFISSPTGPQEVRLRLVQPGGHARGHDFTVHGQVWARLPYINNSTEMGYNPLSQYYGQQEGVSPSSHWNLLLDAGGPFDVEGDYLFRDQAAFGSYQGLWGIMRHNTSAPLTAADSYTTTANFDGMPIASLAITGTGVLSNDLDLDGDAFTTILVSDVMSGTLALNSTGAFSYTPQINFRGQDSFTYQACQNDGAGPCSLPTLAYIEVIGVNTAPLAQAQTATTTEDTPLAITLAGSDLQGDSLAFSIVVSPTNGSLSEISPPISGSTVITSAVVTYTPNANFNGSDSFTFNVCETGTPELLCGTVPATLTVIVDPVNDAPLATIIEPAAGSTLTAGAAITLTGTAIDPEDGDLSAALAWSATDVNGTVSALGSGSPLLASFPAVGSYTITAQVVDSGLLTGTTSLTLAVSPANSAPLVSITAPVDGATVTAGAAITFTGTATDTEDGNLSASLVWAATDANGATLSLGNGDQLIASLPAAGSYTITAAATDSSSASGVASIIVTVDPPANSSPLVGITAPADSASFVADAGTGEAAVNLAGTATDPEDGDLSASLGWSASDGVTTVTAAGAAATLNLAPGTWTITASVSDSGGASSSASVTVTITPASAPNSAPQVSITAPADGASFTANSGSAAVNLAGTAIDPEDGDLSASLAWSASDGVTTVTATGAAASLNLAPGTWTITASVSDSGGSTNSAGVTVTISPASAPNSAPQVSITAPANGASFSANSGSAAVNLTGTATDAEDGDLSASLTWSDESGAILGSGASVAANLSVGAHTVTASVTDSSGDTSSVSISVTVNAPAAESITITQATWRKKNKNWRIQGTGSMPGNTISLYLNGDPARLIGSATVDAAGSWQFSGKSGVNPAAGDSVTAVSSGSGTAAPFPVTIN
ncbi:MAG: hypothetical protein FOGNACKC_05137 [Anaerolineae bacterium]|nr:hypothetical protein [Anaerolineae bacterium]